MTANEFIEKVDNVSEMVFSVNGRKFTICDEYEKGFSIAEWNKQDTEMYYRDAASLVRKYMIDGKSVSEYVNEITIEDYTGF